MHAEQRDTILVLLLWLLLIDPIYEVQNDFRTHDVFTTVVKTSPGNAQQLRLHASLVSDVFTTVVNTSGVGYLVLKEGQAAIMNVVTTVENTWCAGPTAAMSKISLIGAKIAAHDSPSPGRDNPSSDAFQILESRNLIFYPATKMTTCVSIIRIRRVNTP